jgi:PAS domain S-box-containing protein
MASSEVASGKPRLPQESILGAATRVALIATDLQGRITIWNTGAERMLGYSADEMVGSESQALLRLHLPAELTAHGRELSATLGERIEGFEVLVAHARRGGYEERDWTYVRKDGGRLIVQLAMTAVRDATSEVVGFLGTAVDVTGRKQAEEALRESAAKYRQLIDNSHDIIYSLTPEGTFLFVGAAWTRMLGQPVSEVESRPFAEFVHPDDQEACFEFLKKVIQTGERQEGVEYRVQHADGSWRWHTSSATPVRDASGAVTQYDGIGRDITERKQAEEALRRSEANLQAMLANTTDIIAYYDRSRRLVAYNHACGEAFRRMLGKAPAPGARVVDLVPEGTHGYWNANAERALAGESFIVEFEMPVPGGGQSVLESSYHPIRQGADIVGFMTTTRDITERKRVAEELREREKQFRALFDFAPYGCAVTDLEGRYLMVNQAFGTLWGIFAADVLGKTHNEIGVLIEPEAAKRMAAELASTGALRLVEADVSFRDTTATILLAVRPIDFAGKPARLVVTVDISDKKKAERALRQSEERFRRLLQNSNDMLAVIDEQARPISINGASQAVLGYEPAELLGVNALDDPHPDDLETVKKVHARTLAEPGRTQRVEYRARRKDGSWVWIEAVGNNLFADPSVRGIVVNLRDISARKQAEAEREKLQEQLLQSQKMESVGRLAGGVAHDFNNMLGVILGHVDLALENASLDQALRGDLDEIRRAAERSADLTRQLLAFARKQTIAPRVLDINQTLEGMLKILRRLIGEDIDLVWLPGPEAGMVRMDPSQMDQILANLAVNARDAIAGTGKLTIETGRATFDDAYCAEHVGFVAGEYVLLAVSDNGCGMDAETRSHLFEPFFTTKERGKGTGLGLATIFGIVRQNDGFINVYSEPGHGTTFKVYLPRHQPAGTQPARAASAPAVGGKGTVLLVEDEPAIRQVTVRMLARLGYTVISAGTPGEAIQLAREHSGEIDLLLTDVVMPEMNGRDLAKNLLSLRPGLKRLFVSGYTANVIAHHGVLDQGVLFLQKPFSIEALAAKVREALDTTKS